MPDEIDELRREIRVLREELRSALELQLGEVVHVAVRALRGRRES